MSVEIRSGVRFPLLHSTRRFASRARVTKSKITLFLVSGVAFGLGLYATVDPHWAESIRVYGYHGLWKECYTSDDDQTTCFDLLPENQPFWLNVCRGLIVTGVALTFIGLMTSILTILNDNIHGYYTSITMFFGAVFLTSVVMVYKENKEWRNMECAKAYFSAWLGAVMCVIAAFFGFCTF